MGRTERVLIEEAPAEALPHVEEFRGVRRVTNSRISSPEQTLYEDRPVVATMEECRAGKGDYYDPNLRTWVRSYGKFMKLERDPFITPYRAEPTEEDHGLGS